MNFFSTFLNFSFVKVWYYKNLVYLCTRFREATRLSPRWFIRKQGDPWQHSIQTSSTTCRMTFLSFGIKSISKERKTNRQFLIEIYYSGQYKQFDKIVLSDKYYRYNLQRRVWSWLRMNASYRLNTCKSRGLNGACFCETTGARVSNAYPTCPSYWDSLPKGRLIPNNM